MTLGDKIQLLKKKITDVQIMDIMTELGIPHNFANENEVRYLTACHNGDSYKLYFYRSSKSFYCYTHCGALDIVNIVEKRLGYSTLDAYKYISRKIGLDFLDFQYGFGELNLQMSESFRLINKFSKNKAKKEWINFNIIDEKILNMFYPIYHKSFYNDGISIDVMKQFEIQFDLYNNRIIIPHRNWNGDLIAIRCRNLEQELIDDGKKYMPIVYDNKILSAPTHQYFYGLYQNIENIKRLKKVVLVESEKAVMQYGTMYKDNIALALSGSSLSEYQIEILKRLGVTDIILALDKEFEFNNSNEEKFYAIKIDKMFIRRLSLFNVNVIWDYKNLLNYKDSPTDKGKEVFENLVQCSFNKNNWRIYIDGIQSNRK